MIDRWRGVPDFYAGWGCPVPSVCFHCHNDMLPFHGRLGLCVAATAPYGVDKRFGTDIAAENMPKPDLLLISRGFK